MTRSPRAFRPEALRLEARQLLAAGPRRTSSAPDQVGVYLTPGQDSMQVSQQDASATLTVWHKVSSNPLQVQLSTDPSPAIGVNLAALDQTITFAPGQTKQTIPLPLIAGAPNPGEVDVKLNLTAIAPPPNLTVNAPNDLRIMASADAIPPSIVSSARTRQGIELTFSKPMDPATVTNVHNYAVGMQWTKNTTTKNVLGAVFLGKWSGIASGNRSGRIMLRAANYVPTTSTVTLIPRRPFVPGSLLVVKSAIGMPSRARPGAGLVFGQPLTDLNGNAIDGSGSFSVGVPPAGRASG